MIDDAQAAYYAFTGDAAHMVDALLTTPAHIQAAVAQFADLGADELILYCWSRDPTQVTRLADLVS